MVNKGDYVKIITEKEEFTGILMPHPEILEDDVTVIKLDNGYNIGIDHSKIKNIEVIETREKQEKEKQEYKLNPDLPIVSIISLGGTISSRVDYTTGGVAADYTAEDFVEMLPELKEIANIKTVSMFNAMSEDLNQEHWLKLAETISNELNDPKIDGVVVTQGTDTLHFSSSAVSFLLKKINKPVVFTAAQRSIDRGSSDAFMNLLCSVKAAISDIAEVSVCMHADLNDEYCNLINGTKTRKMHSSRRDAFRPVNDHVIAKVYPDKDIEVISEFNKRNEDKVEHYSQYEKNIGIIYTYPGMKPESVDSFKGYKGLVIAATGLGNLPKNILNNVKRLIDSGTVVVITSQTIYGRVHPLVYSNLRELSIKLGCIFLEDMTTESAYVKLGFVIGNFKKEEFRSMLLRNFTGEIKERTVADEFLN